jgi:4-oxalocrotonate tautomerase
MPYINLRVAGKLTRDQKTAIAKEFAETLEKIAHKPKDSTYLVIDEVERENWAKGDKLLG